MARKNNVKWENIGGAYKVLISKKEGENVVTCNWIMKDELVEKLYAMGKQTVFTIDEEDVKIQYKAKDFKDIQYLDECLTSAYYAIVDYKSMMVPDNDVTSKAFDAVRDVLRIMGCLVTEDPTKALYRGEVWSEEWHLFTDLIAVKATTKSVFQKTGERTDFTGLSTFKNAWVNAVYRILFTGKKVEQSEEHKTRKSRFEARQAKKNSKKDASVLTYVKPVEYIENLSNDTESPVEEAVIA